MKVGYGFGQICSGEALEKVGTHVEECLAQEDMSHTSR
jgi:hypothetical protein